MSVEYCSPVFHHALPKYLTDNLERVQKRALRIICPFNTYDGNLTRYGLSGLQSRPDSLCPKLFNLRSSHISGADPGFSERGFGQTSEVLSSQEKVRSKYLRLFHFRGFDRTTRTTRRLRHVAKYNIRRSRVFDLPNTRTNGYRNTFVSVMCRLANSFAHSMFSEFFSFLYISFKITYIFVFAFNIILSCKLRNSALICHVIILNKLSNTITHTTQGPHSDNLMTGGGGEGSDRGSYFPVSKIICLPTKSLHF